MGNKNSGRRPMPTALKLLRGNPGQRKLNVDEPVPPIGDVEKPALSLQAGLVWDRLAPIAIAMGTLTRADVTAFATLCELQATLEAAGRLKDPPPRPARMRPSTWRRKCEARVVAAIKLEKDFAPRIRPYYEMFGLNPASRARIVVPKKADAPVSKWASDLR